MRLAHTFQQRHDTPLSDSPSPPTSPYLPPATYHSAIDFDHKSNLAFSDPSILDLNNLHFVISPNDSSYTHSRPASPSTQFDFAFADNTPLMQNSYAQYPQVRPQHPPNQQIHPSIHSSLTTPVKNELTDPLMGGAYFNTTYLSPHPQQVHPASYHAHKRIPSDSSVGSGGPDSPFTHSSSCPQIVDTDAQPEQLMQFDTSEGAYPHYTKQFPVYAPTQGLDPSYYQATSSYNTQSNNAVEMNGASFRYTMGQMGQRRSQQPVGDVRRQQGSANVSLPVSIDRSMSNIYEDELYTPRNLRPSQQPSSTPGSQHPLHQQNRQLSQTLQTAHNSHLAAPPSNAMTNNARNRSPFRAESSLGAEQLSQASPSLPAATGLKTAANQRQTQKLQADAQALRDHLPHRNDLLHQPKTISPKEVNLDFNESEPDSKLPLFPPSDQRPSSQHYRVVASQNNLYQPRSQPQQSSSGNFAPSTMASAMSNPGQPQYPFITAASRQSSMRSTSDHQLEFPASLTSMESTKSEPGQGEKVRLMPESSLPSSQESVQRPADTSANGGTYTCTKCSCRFENGQKLQKHKREAHVASPFSATSPYSTASPTTPSAAAPHQGQSSSGSSASRHNTQGPHRCDKISPNTGKACHIVFSRSYDLTRHEETIHSDRKAKSKCEYCTEEKTFSRNDALTRHMRVVHPDMEYPVKHRRGKNSEGADVIKQGLERRRR